MQIRWKIAKYKSVLSVWILVAVVAHAAWCEEPKTQPSTITLPSAESPAGLATRPAGETRFSSVGLFDVSKLLLRPRQIHPSIYQASGVSNTTLVLTSEGNVVIDTSLAQTAGLHRRALRRISAKPTRYILLTHAHKDHTGGIQVWKEPGTDVVAHQNSIEFLHYQSRLAEFFARRNSAQFAVSLPTEAASGNFGAKIDATILFEDDYHFSLGGIDFHLVHSPGETYDHVSIWIPQFKAAFVGDNYYRSFPNLYTPRGTKPRWALDYVRSLDRVLEWEPEILVSGHSPPLVGQALIADKLQRYRDAILYVHDETVKGMNQGKSVHTLMQEVQLPKELEQNEKYGSVKWSVRGIYEGYAGWFDGNPSNMYDRPFSDTYPSLVKMAGGPQVVTAEASKKLAAGELLCALHLVDMVLALDPEHLSALRVRRDALKQLLVQSSNAIESGWLLHGIRDATGRLEALSADGSATVTTRFTAAQD